MLTLKVTITRLPIVAAAVALTAAPALGQQSQQNSGTRSGNTTTVAAASLSDDPQDYIGKTVAVREEVGDVIGPNVFTIEDGEFFGLSPDILVFAPDAIASPIQDQVVTVTGVVRKFAFADLEREYGWGWGAYPWDGGAYPYGRYYGTGYGPDYWVRYNDRPVIIASSVTTRGGMQLVANDENDRATDTRATDTARNQGGDQPVGTSGTRGANTITDLSKLTGADAANMAGQQVRLEHVTVGRMTGTRGFWADTAGGEHVFVGLDEDVDQADLRQGQHVMIAGKVMKTPGEASKIAKEKWGLSSDDVNQLMQDKVFIRADALRTASSQ